MLAALRKLHRLTRLTSFPSIYQYNLHFFFKRWQETRNTRGTFQEVSRVHNYRALRCSSRRIAQQHREDFNGSASQVERVKYVQRARNISFVHSYQSSIIRTRCAIRFYGVVKVWPNSTHTALHISSQLIPAAHFYSCVTRTAFPRLPLADLFLSCLIVTAAALRR